MKRRLSRDEIDDILQSLRTFHPDPNFMETSSADVQMTDLPSGSRVGIKETNGKELKMDPSRNFVIETSRYHVKRQLEKIEIYPEAIPSLKEEILRKN